MRMSWVHYTLGTRAPKIAGVCGRFTRYLSWSEIQRLYRLTTDWEKQRNDAPAGVVPDDEPNGECFRHTSGRLVQSISRPWQANRVFSLTVRVGVWSVPD
jgi:hypothetical protein